MALSVVGKGNALKDSKSLGFISRPASEIICPTKSIFFVQKQILER